MIEDQFEPNRDALADDGPPSGLTLHKERRMLELELIKIRNEAKAARLDARAAEIEWMIQRLRASEGKPGPTPAPHFSTATKSRFSNWDEVRNVISVTSGLTRVESGFGANQDVRNSEVSDLGLSSLASGRPSESGKPSPESIPNSQHLRASFQSPATPDSEHNASGVGPPGDSSGKDSIVQFDAGHDSPSRPHVLDLESGQAERPDSEPEELSAAIAVDEERDDAQRTRGRPAAFLISGLAHVVILLLLAAVGIQSQRPKDQVAISGSVTPASESMMESFEIESTDPQTAPTETIPSEVKYDLSPVGELAVSEISADSAPMPPTSASAAMASTSATSAVNSLKSDSQLKSQFCGVEGGGNHFVYMVDSSKSMGDAFQSARRELLGSIDSLTAKQRFYVIFYDKEPDLMRLSSGRDYEPRSVYATPENKAAVKRWAMQIKMDRGWAPYEPMEFALKLKPDVIFLLSDGEFPQKFEDLVKSQNRVVNLFGDSSPISIVHTISYFSKEGESRMRRIAEQNQGQYRHVPKP